MDEMYILHKLHNHEPPKEEQEQLPNESTSEFFQHMEAPILEPAPIQSLELIPEPIQPIEAAIETLIEPQFEIVCSPEPTSPIDAVIKPIIEPQFETVIIPELLQTHEIIIEPTEYPILEIAPAPEPHPPQELFFEPIEEPHPNWEMELAQAYVRAQPLNEVFPPEEGLRMGTAFPNLSIPYAGRD